MTRVDFSQLKNKTLAGLDDVIAPSPSNGQVLQWKSSIQKWAPATPSGGGGGGGDSVDIPATDITLSKTNQQYIAVNGEGRNIKLPNSDPYTTARTPSSHTHGNIGNTGQLNNTDVAVANGDKIVVADASDEYRAAKTAIVFDGVTPTQFLSRKGTWETPGGGGGATHKACCTYAEEIDYDDTTGKFHFETLNGDFTERPGNLVALHFMHSFNSNDIISIDGMHFSPIYYEGQPVKSGFIVAGDRVLLALVQSDVCEFHILSIDRWPRGAPYTICFDHDVRIDDKIFINAPKFGGDKTDFHIYLSNITACSLEEILCIRGDTFTITFDNADNSSDCIVDLSPVLDPSVRNFFDFTNHGEQVSDILLQDAIGLFDRPNLELNVPAETIVSMKIAVMEQQHVIPLLGNSSLYAKVEILSPMYRL